jgi:hypothetical protein
MKVRDLLSINRCVRNKVLVPGRVMFGAGDPTIQILPQIVDWGDNRSVFWLGMELVIVAPATLSRVPRKGASLGVLIMLACLQLCMLGSTVKSAVNPVYTSVR